LGGVSYFILLPVITRLRGWKLAAIWVVSWLPSLVLVPSLGNKIRPIGILFPVTLWVFLALEAWHRRELLWWPQEWFARRQPIAVVAPE
jgi:hypothetical protein